jgi:uncharacterized membrane protein
MADALLLAILGMLALVAGIGGIYAAMKVRRWAQQQEPSESFTLQDLREMRARNDISEEEFQVLKAEVLGRAGDRQ